MKKIAIFNVGGALSSYAEFDNKKILIDLGTSCDFSPVNDFLIPLSQQGKFLKGEQQQNKNKYLIEQLFLSHLDKDHISDFKNFTEHFHPHYMTCPNDNQKQNEEFKINKDLLGVKNEIRDLVLSEMRTREPVTVDNPLASIVEEISLFYIKPQFCEKDETLKVGYANNISLALFIQIGKKTIFLPGDLLKEGMEYLINNSDLKKLLSSKGIDYLIAPHHGLQTSFSEYLFQVISGNKTRLNIISEKVSEDNSKENRSDVDQRYYSSDYSTGENTLKQNAVKTSMGHIVVDFETDETEVKKYLDIQDVINEFI